MIVVHVKRACVLIWEKSFRNIYSLWRKYILLWVVLVNFRLKLKNKPFSDTTYSAISISHCIYFQIVCNMCVSLSQRGLAPFRNIIFRKRVKIQKKRFAFALIQALNHYCTFFRTFFFMKQNVAEKHPIFYGASPLYDSGTHIWEIMWC